MSVKTEIFFCSPVMHCTCSDKVQNEDCCVPSPHLAREEQRLAAKSYC
jgi:hypothetical protein